MKIVLAGGTGYLGSLLLHFFNRDHEVIVLSRKSYNNKGNVSFLQWDGKNISNCWSSSVLEADVVINLSGRTVNCKYNKANKKEILESRTLSTELIGKLLRNNKNSVKLWINLSSATIYRHSTDKDMTEINGELGSGFSVGICKAWEQSFNKFNLDNTKK